MHSLFSLCVLLATSSVHVGAQLPYQDASLPVNTRVQDLLDRMTIQEKASQLMQGDISNWLNTTSGTFNHSGLVENFEQKAGQFYVGYPISWESLATNIKRGQDYAINETRLGIPALVQTEGIHGFLRSAITRHSINTAFADPELVSVPIACTATSDFELLVH